MDYAKLTDIELVERFKAKREEGAFNELFKRHHKKVHSVALRYTGGDYQMSEDITHEVFIEVYSNIDRFKGQGKFFSYLYGIAFNKSKHYRYKQSVRKEDELKDVAATTDVQKTAYHAKSTTPQDKHDKAALKKILEDALEVLTPDQRRVFIMCEFEELSYKEASKTLGISVATVGVLLHKSRKKLKKVLPLETLEIFFFTFQEFPKVLGASVMFWFENTKLLFTKPSSLLLSFYVDGEVNAWQRSRIDTALQVNASYREEMQAYQKIHALCSMVEDSEVREGFQTRFERKLAAEKTDGTAKGQSFSLPRALVPTLAVTVAAVSFVFLYPLFGGSPLSVTQVQGAVQILEPRTGQWIALSEDTKIKKGLSLRTLQQAHVDFTLEDNLTFRVKENSQLTFEELIRSKQKGQIQLNQTKGKTLVGIGSSFKGSKFSIQTPHGSAHAYGTLFLVEVLPFDTDGVKSILSKGSADFTRVMVLEGKVEVIDLDNKIIQTVPPQTEKILRGKTIDAPQPLKVIRKADIDELQALEVPGATLKALSFLEENLSLSLIVGPTRVKTYLEDPKILSLKDYPVLTEKVLKIRGLLKKAHQENNPALHDEVIADLETFTLNHLDPYGQFKPHIHFFLGAFQNNLGRHQEALTAFAQVTEIDNPEWQAMAHLARGIIYEEALQNLPEAHKEYTQILDISEDTPEAKAAKKRLNQA